MTAVFADTSFYVAILNPRDALHAPAKAAAEGIHHEVVTTEFVLAEVGSYFSRAASRQLFVELINRLSQSEVVKIIPSSADLFARGVQLFSERPDKDWSLTDCISFTIMHELGVSEALTADHHFEQAGFKALLKYG